MQLEIWYVVREAFAEAGLHWRPLLRALIVPATALSAVEILEGRLSAESLSRVALWAADFLIYVLYAISCHRIILLGADSLPNRWGVYWTARETRFVGWSIAIFLLCLPILFLLAPLIALSPVEHLGQAASWVVGGAIAAPIAYVVSRASLVLPSTAIDQQARLAEAWELSRNNGWRLTIALAIPGLLLSGAGYLYDLLLGAPDQLLPSIGVAVWFCLLGAVEVTVLSVAYRILSSGEATDASA